LKVAIANVLMSSNLSDYEGVIALSRELGASYSVDPTITPKLDGDRSILQLNVGAAGLEKVFHDPILVGDVEQFCAPPAAPDEDIMEGYPCSAGHTACYISPYGDVYPCVAFPLPSGNLREQKFLEIWNDSAQLKDVRSIRAKDLSTCSSCSHVGTCTRCPGLAYMEGNMRGPSTADCQKSFLKTGIPSANMLRKAQAGSVNSLGQIRLVQIQAMPGSAGASLSC
jgi:AdoMet-dependent heme synthase